MKLNQLLLDYRKSAGLSQRSLCKATGLSIAFVSKYERGIYQTISFENVMKILHATGKSIQEFSEAMNDSGKTDLEAYVQSERDQAVREAQEAFVKATWGEKCPDYFKGCTVCDVWRAWESGGLEGYLAFQEGREFPSSEHDDHNDIVREAVRACLERLDSEYLSLKPEEKCYWIASFIETEKQRLEAKNE